MRTPYFLYAAIAIPIVDVVAFLLVCAIQGIQHPPSSGGNVGNYDLSGLGVLIIWAGVTVIAGIVLSVVSICRKERGRILATVCLILYLLPLLWTAVHIFNFELAKSRLQKFEQAKP